MLVQFGNNWIRPIWQSSEFFSSNYFQIGQHLVLLHIHRGYYTTARRYEFYFRVVKTIFYERAQRVSKILFLTRENKIHIFNPPCNFLFII